MDLMGVILPQSVTEKPQLNPHFTIPLMQSSKTVPTALGNASCGGALFTVPREVRDEIYRLVIKSHYTIYTTEGDNEFIAPRKGDHDFAILEVSKAVSSEALEILYSESVFRFSIDFSAHGIYCVPSHLTTRMKNVGFFFSGLSTSQSQIFPPYSFPTYQDHINTICHAAIADFTGADTTRNHLRIRLLSCNPDVIEILSVHIFERLKALYGFRTVVLEIATPPMSMEWESWILRKRAATWVIREIQNTLQPTLGPATQTYGDHLQYLTFHPGDNMVRSTKQNSTFVTACY